MSFADAVQRLQKADAELASAGPTPFVVPVQGLEAVVAGAVLGASKSDWWLPGLRERVGGVLRDAPIARLVDGHAGAPQYKIAPGTESLGLRALVAVGLAQSDRTRAAVVHLGVAAAADGAFHEALNLAAVLKPNVIFVVAVHPLGGGAPVGPQLAARPADLARAFGIPAVTVDGSVAKAVHDAVAAARREGGPHLVEATLVPGADLVARADT